MPFYKKIGRNNIIRNEQMQVQHGILISKHSMGNAIKKPFMFIILIALFQKLLSSEFFASVEVCNMAKYYRKSDKLRIINFIGCR